MGHSSASRDLRILQITDCHLYGDPFADLLGVNTLESLQQVLKAALPEDGPSPDAVIATATWETPSTPAAATSLRCPGITTTRP